jgi:hypothetical protein
MSKKMCSSNIHTKITHKQSEIIFNINTALEGRSENCYRNILNFQQKLGVSVHLSIDVK